MDYKAKYLKYKNKYFNLKNSLVGGAPFKRVKLDYGLNYPTTQEDVGLSDNTILYYMFNNNFIPVGTIGEIKSNSFSNIVLIMLNDVRIRKNVRDVALYYDESTLPPPPAPRVQLPPPAQQVQLPPQPPRDPRALIANQVVRDRIFPAQNTLPEGMPQPGNFSFSPDNEYMLGPAFEAISQIPGGFESLIPDPGRGGFMFSRPIPDSTLEQVSRAVVNSFSGHSGSSYAWTVRQMQGIARFGWIQYVQLVRNRAAAPAAVPAAGQQVVQDPRSVYVKYAAEEEFCPICYERLSDGRPNCVVSNGTHSGEAIDPVRCGHVFHCICIKRWIDEGHRNCPNCRNRINILFGGINKK